MIYLKKVIKKLDKYIKDKNGTDMTKKKYELEASYMVARDGKNGIRAVGLASLTDLFELAKDPDIEAIDGFATCASY